MKFIFILTYLIASASITCAETYKWEDANGVHFTDNADSIPMQYRANALGTVRPDITTSAPRIQQQKILNEERIKQEQNAQAARERAQIATEALRQQQAAAKTQMDMQLGKVTQDMSKQINKASQDMSHRLARFVGMWLFTGLIAFVVWISVFIDIMRSEFINPSNKIAWLLVVLFLGPLGILLYLLIGQNQKMRLNGYKNKRQAELVARLKPRDTKDTNFDIR
jgi:hypothetical protein